MRKKPEHIKEGVFSEDLFEYLKSLSFFYIYFKLFGVLCCHGATNWCLELLPLSQVAML